TAMRKLVYALKHCAAQGVETNREFLIDVLEHDEFRSGRAHTGFQLKPQRRTEHDEVFAAVARAYVEHTEVSRRAILPSVPIGYRNNPVREQGIGNREQITGNRFEITGNRPSTAGRDLRQATGSSERITILRIVGDTVEAMVDGVHHHFK